MANKHIVMLKTFWKVMINNKIYQSLVIPDMYQRSVYDIDYKKIKDIDKLNLIFDIDNTILPVNDTNVSNELIRLFEKLTTDGFNICIVSNNSLARVKQPAQLLRTKYIANANKPNKIAFDKAMEVLQSLPTNTAMIGDQMLTDIKGAKENGIYAILVEPLKNNYDIKTGTARLLQNIMERKLKKSKKFIRGKYY